jgi:hypothetical protein
MDSLVSLDTNTCRSGAMLTYKCYPIVAIFKYSGYSETVKLLKHGGVTNLVETTSA